MRKVLGFALATLLTLTLSAAAEEVKGTVKAIDRADRSIVLDDGTKLTVSESQLTTLTPGDQVRAMYQTDGSKNVVSDLDFRGIGSDARGTTNWGPSFGMELESIQSE
jgi:cell division septal protein FtsQ